MSDLENDLKRVLHQKADGDYVTRPEAMLGRVEKGAVRLHRKRVGAVVLSTLAIVAAGAALAVNVGNLTNTNPPVVTQTTTSTPGPTQSVTQTTGPSTVPTGHQTVGPPVAGLPSNSTSTRPTTKPTTPTVEPSVTVPVVPGVVVTGFSPRSVAAQGTSTIRVLGDAQCDGKQCYPILLSTDGGKTFKYDGRLPGQGYKFGFNGNSWWSQGGATALWQSYDAGKTWTHFRAPGTVTGSYGQNRGTPVLKIGNRASVADLYQGGGSPTFFYEIETAFDKVHDRSTWGRAVTSGDVDGLVGVTVSNSNHQPRMTTCKSTSTDTAVSSGPGDVVWLLCPTADGSQLLVSQDAGHNWKTVPAKLPRVDTYGGLLAAVNSTTAIVQTGSYEKLMMVTAGGSIRELSVPNAHTLTDLYFQTELVGYLTAGEAISRTTDGGKTWQRLGFDGFE